MSFNQLVGFSHKELRGIAVWLVVLTLIWFLPELYGRLFGYPHPKPLSAEQKQEIQIFLASAQSVSYRRSGIVSVDVEPAVALRYQMFDPNRLEDEVGKQLGLTERQVNMIQRYVEKGGRFTKKADFKKIYAISEADYERLAPYIQIKTTKTERTLEKKYSDEKKPYPLSNPAAKKAAVYLDINQTDSTELLALPGIGPVFASRIVRYRDRLGGFYDIGQLRDVYGMDEERLQGIVKLVFANADDVRKIAINHVDYKQLRAHPYVSPNQANAIVRYREQHGRFAAVEDLLQIVLIEEDFIRKISPYLSFE